MSGNPSAALGADYHQAVGVGVPTQKGQAGFDTETGELIARDGTRIVFLDPKVPANTPPFDLSHDAEADEASPDGSTHYLIGGDPAVVDAIVAWYRSNDVSVPAGYAEKARTHAERADAVRRGEPDPAESAAVASSSTPPAPDAGVAPPGS